MKMASLIKITCFGDFDSMYTCPVYGTDGCESANALVNELNAYFSHHELVDRDSKLFDNEFCDRDKKKMYEIYTKYFFEFCASIFVDTLVNLSQVNDIFICSNLFSVEKIYYVEAKGV